MLKLIKNELFKVFHKKSTYIIMVIMFLFVVLTNAIYSLNSFNEVYTYYDTLEDANNYLANYNEITDSIDDYVYYVTLKSSLEEAQNYEENSWQYEKIMNDYFDALYSYNYNVYVQKVDDLENQELIKTIKKEVSSGNWQYFIKEEKKTIEEELENLKLIASLKELSSKEEKENAKQVFVLEEQIKLLDYRLDENVLEDGNYLDNAINAIYYSLYEVAEYKYGDERTKEEHEEAVTIYETNKYILEEKQDTNNSQTIRAIIINFFSEYSFLILVFIVMIAGASVSDEFNKGTIKSLLTLPYKRSKILLSKYISSMIMLLFGIVYMIILEYIIGGIFFGYSSLSIPYVTYNLATSSIVTVGVFKYLIIQVITNLPKLILLGTLAFAVSTILSNTAFAIAITFCGAIGADIINSLAYYYKIKILNYFVTTNWDFNTFLFGGKSVYGVTLGGSIIVCLIYLLIMLIVSFIVFSKKDIKNI